MQIAIDVLLIILLVAGIVVVLRLYDVLGSVKVTLANVEVTRVEISTTLKRLEGVAETTEQLMREEVTPTLQVVRQTLVNVELTTRGLAETTQIVRGLAGRVEGAQKVFSVGGPIAQLLLKKAGSATGGFFSGITAGIKMVLGRGKKTTPASKQIASKETSPKKAIRSTEVDDDEPIMEHSSAKKPLVAPRKR